MRPKRVDPKFVTDLPATKKVASGESFELTVTMDVHCSFQWFRDGALVRDSEGSFTNDTLHAQTPDGYGTYYVIAKATQGQATAKSTECVVSA